MVQSGAQAFADLALQLVGGGVGESNRQNLAGVPVLAQQQPQEQIGDLVGFAGAGTGLNEVEAVQGHTGLQGITDFRRHAFLLWLGKRRCFGFLCAAARVTRFFWPASEEDHRRYAS